MSAQDTAEKKKRRRRRRRGDAETENVVDDAVAVEDEDIDDDDEYDNDGVLITERKGRATRSRRKLQAETTGGGGNLVTRVGGGVVGYVQGVLAELSKVHWPSPADARRLTVIVVGVTVAASIFLGGLSFLFTELFRIGLGEPVVLGAALAVLVVLGFGYLIYTNRRG